MRFSEDSFINIRQGATPSGAETETDLVVSCRAPLVGGSRVIKQ